MPIALNRELSAVGFTQPGGASLPAPQPSSPRSLSRRAQSAHEMLTRADAAEPQRPHTATAAVHFGSLEPLPELTPRPNSSALARATHAPAHTPTQCCHAHAHTVLTSRCIPCSAHPSRHWITGVPHHGCVPQALATRPPSMQRAKSEVDATASPRGRPAQHDVQVSQVASWRERSPTHHELQPSAGGDGAGSDGGGGGASGEDGGASSSGGLSIAPFQLLNLAEAVQLPNRDGALKVGMPACGHVGTTACGHVGTCAWACAHGHVGRACAMLSPCAAAPTDGDAAGGQRLQRPPRQVQRGGGRPPHVPARP